MKHFDSQKKWSAFTAFTIAEVLITLGIIGIAAEMTIPTLIHNYQKQVVVTQLKKSYSTVLGAMRMATIDNGDSTGWFTSDITSGGETGAKNLADKYLIPYMKISKNCGLTTDGDCSATKTFFTASQGGITINEYWEKFYLSDGSMIMIKSYDVSNRFTVLIDVNGASKPNMIGKDTFYFFFYNNGKFVPEGLNSAMSRSSLLSDADWGCNKSGGRGSYCSGIIMRDGWKIADDYPW